ncbi:MAG: hypothetical protein LBV29_06510 [Azoarcus sp.]|nr:hypothetical protein [Azoarcus sp.]
MATPIYSQTFRVRINEIDPHKRATCAALSNWMMEAASVHADLLGVSTTSLHGMGAAWALTRLVMELDDMPLSEQETLLRTWPTSLERLQFRRDFCLYSLDQRVLARAVSFWVNMDLQSRKVLRLPQEYKNLVSDTAEHAMEVEKSILSRLTLPETFSPDTGPGNLGHPVLPEDLPVARLAGQARILVRRSDLDVNRHVNTVRYMEWLLESVPQSIWEGFRLRRVEVACRAEVFGGTAVSRCIACKLPDSLPGDAGFVSSVMAEEDGGEREVLRALMYWQPVTKL